MVAAAGAGMAAVDHELVGAKAALAGLGIDRLGRGHAVVPAMGGVDVHLDHAGIGGDADHVQARVMGRRVALDMDGQVQLGRGRLGGGQQFKVILQRLAGRHEQAKPPVARLDGDGGAHRALRRIDTVLRHDALAAALFGPDLPGLVVTGADRGQHGRLFGLLAGKAVDLGLNLGAAGGQTVVEIRQRRQRDRGIGRVAIGILRRRNMGQPRQRQAKAHRAVAGDQEQMPAPGLPHFRLPARPGGARLPALQGQHEARRFGQPARKDPRET